MTGSGGEGDGRGSETFDALLREIAHATPASVGAEEDLVGTRLDHYRLTAKLGSGGMGVVYRATDEKLRRDVALKVLPGALAGDDERRRRFLREARSAASINHPHIATVHDVGEAAGRVYLAMELVEGTTLRARLAGGALPAEESVRIAKQIARGLARAHERGIVHRDLKPENVMLTRDGDVKILDFGIAKLGAVEDSASAIGLQETQTAEGRVVGTPGYMSPEQMTGRPVDHRSDLFSFGVVLREMLAGDWPGTVRFREADVGGALGAVIDRCTAASPADRFARTGDLLEALEALAAPPPRRRWMAGVLGVAALAVVVGVIAVATGTRHGAGATAAAPASAASAPAPGPTSYTDLPLPSTTSSEARSEYAAGMQLLRDDNWFQAEKHFERVVALDPTMAAGHMRLAVLASWLDADKGRVEFARASALRSQLGARDQAFLDALEPVLGRAHQDNVEARRRMDAASARYPLDVEILDWLAILPVPSEEQRLELSMRATGLDPLDAQAWENVGKSLALLDRLGEARRALERCASIASASGDCVFWLAQLDAVEGRCEDYDRDARVLADRAQQHDTLAQAEASLGRSDATVRELLGQDLADVEESRRPFQRLANATSLAIRAGRFADARALLGQEVDALAVLPTTNYDLFAPTFIARVFLAREVGDDTRARALAGDFLARSEAWSRSIVVTQGAGADLTIFMARVAALAPAAIAALRVAWIEDPLRQGTSPGLLWALGWAASAFTADEASDAISVLERNPRFRPPRVADAMLLSGAWADASAGHVYLLAGRTADAVPHLRRALASCLVLSAPFSRMHAALDLGTALEKQGDVAGACGAYGQILAAWGAASPRSVTADAARERRKSIRCRE